MAGNRLPSVTKSRLNGDDLRAMFNAAMVLLEGNVNTINALNVFPVPDGDTGTNMFLTMRDVMGKVQAAPSASAGDVAKAMANAALMGARGNSGVILSQLFSGMAAAFDVKPDFGSTELAQAFHKARELSYKSVENPVEGTMLTVISSVAEAAETALTTGAAVPELYKVVCEAARDSVARTPTMLPVLREAGVVDAGGLGLSVILEGARRWVWGEGLGDLQVSAPEPIGLDASTGAVSIEFLETTEEELYGYCTQFLIQGREMAPDAIREEMAALAHSTIVVGDSVMVKVHVHADDPGPVLSAAVTHGTLAQVNIQNMDEQHGEFSVARREESAAPLTVVAVAGGRGLGRLFANLGASRIVPGGDTMNPSVQDLLSAVNSAPSNNVIILPNNRNIVPAATQASELSEKCVRVVPSRSIPQGIAAVLALNPERDMDSNVAAMEGALTTVQTGEITEAIRAATLNDVSVRPGQLIGLLEHRLVVAGNELRVVVTSLLQEAGVSEGDLVTLYWGGHLTDGEAEEISRHVIDRFPGVEVELVEGGQPHYHFLVSIE